MPVIPRPIIGDFRPTPVATATPDPDKAVAIPDEPDTRQVADVMEKTVEDMKTLQAAEESLTPAERYQKRLKEAKITLNDATVIYDAVLSKGYYEEYVRLGKAGRAVFRTRLYEDSLRLQTALELQKPQLVLTQDELITRYNLAASLYEWQGKPIPHESDTDFDNTLKLIRKMPGPVYALLATALSKFDQKIMLIFGEGATENFS